MKATSILSMVLTALCAGRCFADVCDSKVVRFVKAWPPDGNSTSVLMITCCATWIASLQVQRNSVDLTAFQRERRSIVIRNTGSGDCVIMTVRLLQKNVNGDLIVKCNAEKGGFEQPCEYLLYNILPPAPAPTTMESTPDPPPTNMESTTKVTDITIKKSGPGSTPVNTVDNVTLSGQRSPEKDKSTITIALIAAAIVIVLVAAGASVLAVVMVKLRKCCTTGAEAQFTIVHVRPDPKPMDQRVVIDADDGGHTKESKTSMIPKQPQDNTSASECYPRRRLSMPGHSMMRSDFKTTLSAPNLTQLQSFNDEKSQEVNQSTNEPIQSSVECTDKNTSNYGGRVFVNL